MARERKTKPRARREREPEAPPTVVFEDDHEATTYAIILAGLCDPATDLKEVPAALEVADALFNGWLDRFHEPDDDPRDPDDDD